jgi:hypothetical protein
MNANRLARTALLLMGGLLAWTIAPPPCPAQAPGGDEALERLLEKAQQPNEPKPDARPDGEQPAAKPKELSPDDEGLDSLLKKLGETPDEPSPRGKPVAPTPGEPNEPGPQPPDKPADGPALEGKEKALDEHLEELTGRKKKPKQDDQQAQKGDDSGPLAEAIKKMEEARKRLSDADTGEGTRKTQGEIVKELDQILQRLRQQQGNGKAMRLARRTQQAGQGTKPGDQQGDQPNNTGAGVGASQPKKPTVGQVLAGRKDTWGDLPPNLREEMENVLREEMLPAKRDLIIRYYSSVARKGRAREEASR